MKFLIRRNFQGRSMPGMPVEVMVGPVEGRTGYRCPGKCLLVYPVSPLSIPDLIERRLVLQSQREHNVFVCSCLGELVSEQLFPEILQEHISTWAPLCGEPLDVYTGHLQALLRAHADYVRTGAGSDEHLATHSADCASRAGVACDCGLPKLRLERPLAVIDLETTDIEPTTCAIFQFGVTIIMPDGSRKCWEKTFKPWTPITPKAEEKTGTTNAMVEGCPPFSQFASQILNGLAGKDLAGFNLKSFDLVCLDEELRRCDLRLNLNGVTIIDALHIFQRKDPRDLAAAVKKFCRRDHDGAHNALADAMATADVIESQIATYPDLAEMSLTELDKFSLRDPDQQMADLAGKLYRDSDGDLRYAFGKSKDVKVRHDASYALWMLKSNPPFPGSTCDVLRTELNRLGL